MGKSSDDVRQNIKQTVSAWSDTVSDVTSKADVRSRVKDTLNDAGDNVGRRLQDISNAVPDAGAVRDRVSNPYVLSLGLLAAGVLAGLLVPLSGFERSRLKPIGDDLARRAVEARDEIVDQSRAVVQETIAAAQDSAQKHGEELAHHLGAVTEGEAVASGAAGAA
jgi:hypothetical protein